MEGLVVVLAVCAFAPFIHIIRWSIASARVARWKKTAEAIGMTDMTVVERLGVEMGFSGTVEGLPVRIEGWRGRYDSGTRVSIGGLQHQPLDLMFRAEDPGTALSKAIGRAIGERDIETADAAFDERVYLGGSPAVAHAVLDAETRLLVLGLVQGRLQMPGAAGCEFQGRAWFSDGSLYAELNDQLLRPEVVRGLLAVAHRLVRPSDLAARLAENAGSDPLAAVRLANLNALTRDYPLGPATQAALRAGLADVDEGIRFRAAKALGEEGRAVLLEIAASDSTDEARAASALAALAEHLPAERALEILGSALTARRLRVAEECVRALACPGATQAVERLGQVLASEGGGLALAAARALGAIGDPVAQPALVEALSRDEAALRVAAAEALGRVGTVSAVASLREAAGRNLLDGALNRAARQAIAEIQARLTGAAAGQLSLAGGDAGRLSLVSEAEARGDLSWPEPPEEPA